ncbi:hypothetical protein B0H14DRAFT_3495966 [Mycena olivaceomarginata]|nr:hypothetical protein B0H14DRAFT_3495966 [Mycena olivaceomarginata]
MSISKGERHSYDYFVLPTCYSAAILTYDTACTCSNDIGRSNYMEHTDGESVERVWSYLTSVVNRKSTGPGKRRDALDDMPALVSSILKAKL